MDITSKIFLLLALVLTANCVSCADNFRKFSYFKIKICELKNFLFHSATGIERCRNEDKECLTNAWNKYLKLTVPNGKNNIEFHFLLTHFQHSELMR